jgi:hypothetical protein
LETRGGFILCRPTFYSNSSICIAIRLRTRRSGFDSRRGQDIFLSSVMQR